MLSDRERGALDDIVENIGLARTFVAGLDFPAFEADTKTVYAVVRCLEIISEASRRLTPAVRERHSSIRWGDIAGAGNIYRHEYKGVQTRTVWNTVHEALGSLEQAARAEFDS